MKPPSALDIKGLKKYQLTQTLRPGEKKRRIFVNEKMEEIAREQASLSKADVVKEANKAWLIEKANGMEGDFKDITASLVEAAKKNGKLNLKKNTISNSLERISSIKKALERTDRSSQDQAYYKSQLVKAMDALRKITALRMGELNNMLRGTNNKDSETNQPANNKDNSETNQPDDDDVIIL